MCYNTLIDVQDAEHASGVTYLTLYRHFGDASLDPGPINSFSPVAVGHYTDAFVLTPDGWRFAKRELSLAFQNMEYFPVRQIQSSGGWVAKRLQDRVVVVTGVAAVLAVAPVYVQLKKGRWSRWLTFVLNLLKVLSKRSLPTVVWRSQ